MKSLMVIATVLLLTSGCAPSKTSDLMAPAPTYTADKAVGDGLTIQFNPRVDILFVIDNSKSMADEQEKLKAASASFVEKLGGNSVIDYRVGVITVFDKTHCGTTCYPAGKLRAPFISRSKDAQEQIKNILNVGVQEIKDGGPEFEEIFYPITVATSPEMNAQNGGFIRPDSHVVIVMVSDESDSSSALSIDDFLESLQKNIGLGRLDLYAIVTKSAADRNNTVRDRAPIRIQKAIEAADGIEIAKSKIFNIKDPNFGDHLGAIVTDIKKRVLSQELFLPSVPESKTIKLFYGEDEMKQGWSYNANPNRPTITINEDIRVDYAPNKRFRAEYIKIEQFSVQKGKVTVVNY